MKFPTKHPKGFHLKYIEICKIKNLSPVIEVKNKDFTVLQVYGDRLKIDDWLAIIISLSTDTTLHFLSIKLRKNLTQVIDNLDNEKKVRKAKDVLPIITKFILSNLINAVSECLENNKNIKTLILEGLPLTNIHVNCIAKCLSKNTSVKNLSLAKCSLGNEGCEIICSTITHLPKIESVNLSQCFITCDGMEAIIKLIKNQKIVRFTKGWENCLRYRDINPNQIAGIKRITLNSNIEIKDEGVKLLSDVLIDDLWLKAIDMNNCGVTDIGAKYVIELLNFNKTIALFDLKNNKISNHLLRHINIQLNDGDINEFEETTLKKNSVEETMNSFENLKEQLSREITNRENIELLNDKLHKQLLDCEKEIQIKKLKPYKAPDGFTLIEKTTFENLKKELENFKLKQNSYDAMKLLPIFSSKKRRLRKVKSETIPKNQDILKKPRKISKSECFIPNEDISEYKPTYIEMSIGDSTCNDNNKKNVEMEENKFIGMDALNLFLQKQCYP